MSAQKEPGLPDHTEEGGGGVARGILGFILNANRGASSRDDFSGPAGSRLLLADRAPKTSVIRLAVQIFHSARFSPVKNRR